MSALLSSVITILSSQNWGNRVSLRFSVENLTMINTSSTDQTGRATPKPCPKCGAVAEQHKAGSNRFWVQCSKLGKNGNCSGIGQQGINKKEAIDNWNKLK